MNPVRREARERALQVLFQLDLNPDTDLDPVFLSFWEQQKDYRLGGLNGDPHDSDDEMPPPLPRLQRFSERLVRGVSEHREAIDRELCPYLRNWRLSRLGAIERNVLRLAVYELFYERDVPPVVCINEAVDMAKYFSSRESGRFVNAILDRMRMDAENREPDASKRRKRDP